MAKLRYCRYAATNKRSCNQKVVVKKRNLFEEIERGKKALDIEGR
jgi:hypothetical protein